MTDKLVVGVCDDEEYIYSHIEKILIKYGVLNNIKLDIQFFSSGVELLEKMPDLDMLLLDIDMPKIDGIRTAEILNERGIDYKIILLTCKEDRYKEGYKIGATRFVTKPINEEELFEAITNNRERILGMSGVSLYLEGRKFNVLQRDIYYFMADGAQTKIYTKGVEYRSENSLSMWEELLDSRLFVRTHKSFIVNVSHIKYHKDNVIYLTSSEKILISRRMKSKFLEKYMDYDTKYR